METDRSTEEQVGEEPREPSGVQCEMPKYECHHNQTVDFGEGKSFPDVHALEIAEITFDAAKAHKEGRETTGKAVIMPADEGFASFEVSAEYVAKHLPQAGGYYVVYEDGYKSWSPKEAFEKEYSKVD